MDREIPKKEIRQRRAKTLGRAAVVMGLVVTAIACCVQLLRDSVYRKDLHVAVVDRGRIEVSLSASGTVKAYDEIINSPVSTRILEVYQQEGDSVEAGTPLLRLDLQTAQADCQREEDQSTMSRLEGEIRLQNLEMQVQVCAMRVDKLETNVRNERYLDSLGSGTMDRVREAELAHQTALLELQQLRHQLRAQQRVQELEQSVSHRNIQNLQRTLTDAQIRAPKRAIVTYINNNVGAQVAQGERVAVVSDLSHFQVEGSIADAYSDRVVVGGRVIVKVGSEQLEGTVTAITPTSRNGIITFAVRLADPSNERLRPGMRTDVYVMSAVRDNVLRIHNGPYYIGAGQYELFVFDGEDELVKRQVQLGDANFDHVEVVKGLREGDRVVTNEMKEYKGKNKVKVKEK